MADFFLQYLSRDYMTPWHSNFHGKIGTYEEITQRQMSVHLPLSYVFVGGDFSAEISAFKESRNLYSEFQA